MSELIFVTGASGYLGSHVVDALLAAKYRVRIAARGSKVAQLTTLYEADPETKGFVEVVEVPDTATHDFSHDFKGVSALVHTAASVPIKQDQETVIKDAIEGTLNIIRQAQKAGIKRVVYTSSIATIANPEGIWSNDQWNPITKEIAAASGNPMYTYGYAKTTAERELWKFTDEHPDLDVTSLNPPYLYGPLAKHFTVDHLNISQLSTASYLGKFINPKATAYPETLWLDVRDAAKAHVLALHSPLQSEPGVGRKRLLFAALEDLNFETALDILATERPALKDRLIQHRPVPATQANITFDQDRIQAVLGMKSSDFTPLKKTLLDNVDALVSLEKKWISEGAKAEDLPKY